MKKEEPSAEETVEEEEKIKKDSTKKEVFWIPKTESGKKVKKGELVNISDIFSEGTNIREAEIVDALMPNLQSDFIMIGQVHGKFGGGKRRFVKQTQKKTAEGNKPHFTTLAVVGDENGFIGVGAGTAKETIPSREKALRNAKRNIMMVGRGCGSWECGCGEPHSLPFQVEGKSGSVYVKLMPAPRGTGLVVEDEIKKLLKLAGYKDVWSKTFGQTRKKINFVNACVEALKKTVVIKPKRQKILYGNLKDGK